MQQINEDLKSGQFSRMYLLFGEEAYLRRQYMDKLKNALSPEGDSMNTHYFEGKDVPVSEVIDLAETMPFFAERRVIIMENTGLFKAGGEKLAEYLENPAPAAFFVFAESEVDKRSKLFKQVQKNGRAVCFDVQDERTLKRWIAGILKKDGKQITESCAEYFLDKTGTDMGNIRSELEKLICYCMDRDVVEKEDVDMICTTRISSHIFDMVAAIGDKQTKKALTLYYDLLALKEPPMRILFLIARQCNTLLQAKQLKNKGFDNKAIGEKTGLPGFVAGKYVAQAAKFKEKDLKRAVERCVEAEEAVKTGRMNDTMSVELLIMSVL
ncbi:MAG: DNA polymerase III subunit delta [Lachnospiraceae bacterium]|nr:DNA polymerase III subunit delta [Lachnospiraceae bacterium]